MCLNLEFGGVVLAWFSLFRSTNFSDVSPIKPTVSPVPLFHEMGQDSVDTQYKSCCLYSKVVPGSAPVYILGLLQVHTPFHIIRSSDTRLFKMFKVSRYNRKQYGFRSFSCSGPQVLNCLSLSDTVQHFLCQKQLRNLPLLTFLANCWNDVSH